jgi:DNA-directed RNA polymerase II subunit RPB2
MAWEAIESYFEKGHLERLVRGQVESYNAFISSLEQTIQMFNPVPVHSDQFFNKELQKYSLDASIRFSNLTITRPMIHENNGTSKLMFPQEARTRGFTYWANTTVDITIVYTSRSGPTLDMTETHFKTLTGVGLGKLPVMLKSALCVLTQYAHLPPDVTGECKFDPGGYFIVGGKEKTILAQERAAENIVYCFQGSGSGSKYLFQVEIRSLPYNRRISPKQLNMALMRDSGTTNIQVTVPRIRKPIPLAILFRALGVETDLDICRLIVLDDQSLMPALMGTLDNAAAVRTKDDAINYIATHAMYMPQKIERANCHARRREFTIEVLKNDVLPHCRTPTEQRYMIGYMACHLLKCSLGRIGCDDRDSLLNKRVDLPGVQLQNLYRNYFNKVIKDMQKQIVREMNGRTWKTPTDIVNATNVYKFCRSSTIENGIKRHVTTGDFGMNKSKAGVAQMLNRLTYAACLSHLRRVNTPVDKSGKLVAPRKLHTTKWGFMCPAETPEGQSVGVVQNLSYMTHVTLYSNADPVYEMLLERVVPHERFTDATLSETKVFINGTWVGNSTDSQTLFLALKDFKYTGVLNPYISIVFDYTANEIVVCTDAGRLVRPVFRMHENRFPTPAKVPWDDLVVGPTSCIEYIDPAEQNGTMIAIQGHVNPRFTYRHGEIHPSLIFGVLASCIPFPDFNQSPRNTYQCAMGKQAIGWPVSNPHLRLDKTTYVLANPHRPLVDTRLMNILKLHNIPSGMPVIVAIMSINGYNQEDSVILNEGSVKRGLFWATVYRTEKDEDKKHNGDDEIRCKPDEGRTKGIQFGNYSKLGPDGFVPHNTRVENMDVILGKVAVLRDARNDPTKQFKFRDESHVLRTTDEPCYIDKNVTGVNGDGYPFSLTRLRTLRPPQVGDKFSSRHGQKGTVGMIMPECDMPFTSDGIRPDIIINPHAIPSRMTVGHLQETFVGKLCLELGLFGDGTAFTNLSAHKISADLVELGYHSKGNELMTNGITGHQYDADIFIGPTYYQRLKHMVEDKKHSRASGPMVSLTRQPAEGRARDGGLRYGEMERDCMIGHGADAFNKERMLDVSDKYVVHTCRKCGIIAAYNVKAGIYHCRNCDNRTDFSEVHIPYACKLLFQELTTMNVLPRIMA